MRALFQKGIRHGVPIGLGYLSVSFAFGIQAIAAGLTPWEALLISMTNLTSAGQLAGIGLIATQAPLVEMALAQFTINLRYALMSLSLSQKMGPDMGTGKRMIFAFGNTDEIFAVAMTQPGTLRFPYLAGLMVVPYIGWSLGTFLGAAAGSLLPVFVRNVLGIAIYGMFLAVVLPAARKDRAICVAATIAGLISLGLRYLPWAQGLSGGYRMILCAVLASCIAAALFPVPDGEEEEKP